MRKVPRAGCGAAAPGPGTGAGSDFCVYECDILVCVVSVTGSLSLSDKLGVSAGSSANPSFRPTLPAQPRNLQGTYHVFPFRFQIGEGYFACCQATYSHWQCGLQLFSWASFSAGNSRCVELAVSLHKAAPVPRTELGNSLALKPWKCLWRFALWCEASQVRFNLQITSPPDTVWLPESHRRLPPPRCPKEGAALCLSSFPCASCLFGPQLLALSALFEIFNYVTLKPPTDTGKLFSSGLFCTELSRFTTYLISLFFTRVKVFLIARGR